MRKLPAGLFSLALAATIGLSFASSGAAAPSQGAPAATGASEPAQTSDELPNPLEDKRRELREEALTRC